MSVLWDTSGVIAFLRADDPHHDEAMACTRRLEREGAHLVLTNFIVSEIYTLLRARISPDLARRWLRENPILPERITASDEERAKEILLNQDDKDYSYVDATSFAVMERLDLDTAFTFDRHFEQFGWKRLSP